MTYEMMKKVQNQMEEELDDAYNYIKLALELKDSDRRYADAYYTMSQQEVSHMNVLHGLATQSIKELDGASEHYERMKVIYTFLHERLLDKSAQVNTMLTMYKT